MSMRVCSRAAKIKIPLNVAPCMSVEIFGLKSAKKQSGRKCQQRARLQQHLRDAANRSTGRPTTHSSTTLRSSSVRMTCA